MSWYEPWTWGDESSSAVDKRNALNQTADASNAYADQSQQGNTGLDTETSSLRDALRRQASGADSLSAEQLRQSMGQNLAVQRSMAAGAAPQNAAMSARTAAIQAGRIGSGLAGQQATAGIEERNAANKTLGQLLLEQRGQNVQSALGGRQTAVNAYNGVKPEGSFLDKWGPAITGAAGLWATRK